MAAWSRARALLTMTSGLGSDALIPVSLDAREAISEPFIYDLRVVSQQGQIDPDALLNRPACVTLQANGVPARYFHGIVQTVSAEGEVRGQTAGQFQAYRILLRPRLWFLGQTIDCRVYEKLSVADILKRLFADAGLTDYTVLPSGPVREYTVQFNESDLHFATRLMEEEGYFYFFAHTDAAHKLIVANQNTAFKDIPGATMHMRGGDTSGTLITDWSRRIGTVRGKMKLKDYDPANPDTLLQDEKATTLSTGGAPQRDDFRWPALTFDNGTVADRSTREMEAAEAVAALYDGSSQFGKLVAGGKITVADKPATSYNGTYALREVAHRASDESWLTQGATAQYSNTFTALPFSVPWRQPMATPRPHMEGIHTALVLGPATGSGQQPKSQEGEEVFTDSLARVKLRFYWDHRAEATGGGACWARVVQPWAGKGWGAQFIPRVGTEVAVAFVDGDPDRPIVIGGLYNGRDTPIYSSDDKTKSGFRSRSSLKGGVAEFSEFTFDDKKGSELVFLHAQKDLTTEVEHDQTLTVDNCRVVTVKKDETVHIQNNQDTKIDNNQTIKIGNQQTTEIQSGRKATIDSGGDALTVQAGDYKIDVSSGAMKVSAMTSIELTVGSNTVKIDQSGVAINALMIKLAGETMLDMKAPMSSLKGDGMLTLKGGIMMLN
jgi:type VI secretion system secreted protein VgrG